MWYHCLHRHGYIHVFCCPIGLSKWFAGLIDWGGINISRPSGLVKVFMLHFCKKPQPIWCLFHFFIFQGKRFFLQGPPHSLPQAQMAYHFGGGMPSLLSISQAVCLAWLLWRMFVCVHEDVPWLWCLIWCFLCHLGKWQLSPNNCAVARFMAEGGFYLGHCFLWPHFLWTSKPCFWWGHLWGTTQFMVRFIPKGSRQPHTRV